jgi:hypothetical protein
MPDAKVADPDIAALLTRRGWEKTLLVPELGECWEWMGCRLEKRGGHGHCWFQGKAQYVHRLAHRAWRGEIPDNLRVLHKCDNPPCLNPEHLYLGTPADNVRDMIERGRHSHYSAPGLSSSRAKLNAEQVLSIRALARQGLSDPQIAPLFGISRSSVRRIRRGECYPDVVESEQGV